MDKQMEKSKDSKRKGSQEPSQAPAPERRFPDANRPDTLRPGPGERERKGRRQGDDEEAIPAEPVK